ncbi:uncharacterized protein PHA67_005606 isoform 1-T1 [Liasis olivaceus]
MQQSFYFTSEHSNRNQRTEMFATFYNLKGPSLEAVSSHLEERKNPSNSSQELLFRGISQEDQSWDSSPGNGTIQLICTGSSAFSSRAERVVEPPTQGHTSFEVAVYFSEDWALLDPQQKPCIEK